MAKIFISYSSKDRDRVGQLVRVLEQSDYEVWWDRELLPHHEFEPVLLGQIDEASAVVVVWTQNSIDSNWVMKEVDRAGSKLVSVRMDMCLPGAPYDAKHIEDMTSNEGHEYAFATMRVLQSIKYVCDGRAQNPTSQDVLERKLAQQDEMLAKILAATEAKDGQQSVVQPGAREDAAVQTVLDEPEIAEIIAADGLRSAFQSESVRIEAQNLENAKRLRNIGVLAYDRDPATALEAYREATRLDGSDFWSWIYLARLEERQAGDVHAAIEAAKAALGVSENDRESAIASSEVADRLLKLGDVKGAIENYRFASDSMRSLAAANPGSAQAQRDVSVSLNKLGDVAVKAGDLVAARTAFEEDLDIARRLAAENPESAEAQRDVSVSLNRLGDVAVQAGDLGAARTAFTESLETLRRLAADNPGSAEAQRDVSISLNKLGDVDMQAGDLVAARTAFKESHDILVKLAAENPGSAQAQRDVIVSLAKLAQMTGEVTYWQQALPIVEKLAAEGRLAPADAWMLDRIKSEIAAAEEN